MSFFRRNRPITTKAELADRGIHPNEYIPDDARFRVIQLQDHSGKEYWIGMHNFEVIKRYNPSDLYAMAVYQLSHVIREQREKGQHA